MLVGLGHVDLVCADLEASLAFYARVFGVFFLDPDGFRIEVASRRDARLGAASTT